MPTLKPPFRERPGLASLPGEVAAGVGGGLRCQPGPELLLASLLVDCNLATGTGVHDLVSHCCSGRGARVRNALEVSPARTWLPHVRAGADAVFRCKFILSLVRGGGGLERRRILQRSLVPGRSYVDRGS